VTCLLKASCSPSPALTPPPWLTDLCENSSSFVRISIGDEYQYDVDKVSRRDIFARLNRDNGSGLEAWGVPILGPVVSGGPSSKVDSFTMALSF
jgi:hypothetical protein